MKTPLTHAEISGRATTAIQCKTRLRLLLRGVWMPLWLAALPPFADASSDPPKDSEDEIVALDPIEVTGSLILRAELEGPAPVKMISRSELEQSGRASFGDFMQQLPEAGYSANHESSPAIGANYRGMSVLNLRGADPGNTLVLIDGRRAVLSGVGWNTVMFADLNRIPVAMVERVEILQDCGAIYGSGAAAGVVNVILRKNYNGAEVTARYGNSFRTDVAEKSISVLAGAGNKRTSLTVGLTYFAKNPLLAADTTFARTADLTDRYAGVEPINPTRIASGFDLRSNVGPQARVWLVAGQINGLNGVSIPGLPMGAAITRLPGVAVSPGTTVANAVTPSFTAPSLIGTGGQFNAAAASTFVLQNLTKHASPSNLYNQNEFLWLTNQAERSGVSLSWSHTVSPRVTTYARLAYQHNWTHIESDVQQVSAITVPKTNYWNPFGVDVLVLWRPVEMGPRASGVVDETLTGLLGLRGTLANAWQWDTACSYGYDRNKEIYGNYISRGGWDAAIAKSTPDALNVFGGAGFRNPAAVIDPLRVDWGYEGKSRAYAWDGKISGELFTWPMGAVSGGLLAEARREEFGDVRVTDAVILGNYFEWKDPTSTRTIWAAAAEVHVPLIKRGEHRLLYAADLSLAGRFDQYSEGFDSGLKPYFGLRVQPTRWLTLRASLARTFRAPTLPMLHGRAADSYFTGWEDVRRPFALTRDPADSASATRLMRYESSPDLEPAHSQVWQYGFMLDVPGRWLKGLTLGATYSHLEEFGAFDMPGNYGPAFFRLYEVNGGLGEFIVREPGTANFTNTTNASIPILSSQPGPPGTMTTVAPGETVSVPGRIRYVRNAMTNLNYQRSENYDFSLTYLRTSASLGRIQVRSALSYLEFWGRIQTVKESQVPNFAGMEYWPRVRMQNTISWMRGGWGAVLSNNYIGPRGNIDYENGVEIEAYSTFDAQLSYEFSRKAKNWGAGTRVTLGVDNVMDCDPPLTFQTYGYRPGDVRRPAGRFFYVSLKRDF
jgi:iron complex outermembrane receptor protein